MDLLIVGRESDSSLQRFEEEAKLLDANVLPTSYEQLSSVADPYPKLDIKQHTSLLARQSFDFKSKINNESLIKIMLETYRFRKIHDEFIHKSSHLQLEDKLYQAHVFQKLDLPYPKLLPATSKKIAYPVIVKLRSSSMNRGNYIANSRVELESYLEDVNVSNIAIIQKFYVFKQDLRVIVMKNRIFGVAARSVQRQSMNKVRLRTVGQEAIPQIVVDMCLALNGEIKADLLGIDIGVTNTGKYYFIEYNISPQFLKFEKFTGLNVAKEVVNEMLSA